MTARNTPPPAGDDTPKPSSAAGQAGTDEVSAKAFTQHASLADAQAAIAAGEATTGTATWDEALDKGYLGVSPSRELSGLPDKGLSLPSVTGRA